MIDAGVNTGDPKKRDLGKRSGKEKTGKVGRLLYDQDGL